VYLLFVSLHSGNFVKPWRWAAALRGPGSRLPLLLSGGDDGRRMTQRVTAPLVWCLLSHFQPASMRRRGSVGGGRRAGGVAEPAWCACELARRLRGSPANGGRCDAQRTRWTSDEATDGDGFPRWRARFCVIASWSHVLVQRRDDRAAPFRWPSWQSESLMWGNPKTEQRLDVDFCSSGSPSSAARACGDLQAAANCSR
jgi:hypothetical protein